MGGNEGPPAAVRASSELMLIDVARIERNVAVLRARLARPDRGDVEGGRGRGIWRLSRCGESERRDGGEEQIADDGHRSRFLVECTTWDGSGWITSALPLLETTVCLLQAGIVSPDGIADPCDPVDDEGLCGQEDHRKHPRSR